MPNLFELFRFSKQFEIKDGSLVLVGLPVYMIPVSILTDIQKGLVEGIGLQKAYEIIYESAKRGSIKYNEAFIKTQGQTDAHRIIDWQTKIVSFAGWGILEIAKIDMEHDDYRVVFKNSLLPKEYGKAGFAVDFVIAGFVAGGLTSVTKRNMDAIETKCISLGDPHCTFEVGPPAIIKEKQLQLWRNQKVI